MKVSLIVAVARNGVIGRNGALPWRLSSDLVRFKRLTMGHPVVMGRRTWESIGRPLAGRRNIVVSRRPEYRADGAEVASSLEAALALVGHADEVFVIGGADVFLAALPVATRVYRTWVEAEVEGDVRMPDLGPGWRVVFAESVPADAKNEWPTTFEVLERAT